MDFETECAVWLALEHAEILARTVKSAINNYKITNSSGSNEDFIGYILELTEPVLEKSQQAFNLHNN